MKYLLTLLLLLPTLVQAQLKPVGTHSWQDFTNGKTVHAIGSSVPINYQKDDGSWERIDSRWESVNDTTWRVVKGNHKTYAFADGRAYYFLPRKGVRHAIGTDTRRLIKFNKSDSTWSTLFVASIDSVRIGYGVDELDPCSLIFHDIFPGVDKVLIYDRGRYVERYLFHQEARDSLANHGPWTNYWVGTATKLDLDSLNLNFHDSLGQFGVGVKGRLIHGWLKCQKTDTMVFMLSRNWLWAEDTLVNRSEVIVRKWIVKLTGKSYLVEMFNPVLTASWAEGDIWHNASFGNENEEITQAFLEGRRTGSIYEAPSAGTLDSIKAYIEVISAPHMLKIAAYEWNGPSSVADYVDSTEIIDVPAGGASWIMFDFILNASVTAGTKYSLTLWGEDTGGNIYGYSGTSIGDSTWVNYIALDAWPSTITPENIGSNRRYSILCYYTEGAPPEAAGQVIIIQQ